MIEQNAKTIFSTLVAKGKESNLSQSKTELSHFKKLLESSKLLRGNLPLYASFVKKTWIYRGLFLSIATLFFFLAMTIHPKTFTWSASMLLGSLISTKALIVTGCVAIGSIAMLIGASLRTANELVRFKVNAAYHELWKIHKERQLKKKIHWFTDCKEKLHSKSVLHHLYRDVCDKIDHASADTVALIQSIEKQHKMTPEYKERLIEQTLDELDGRLRMHLNGFRSSWID